MMILHCFKSCSEWRRKLEHSQIRSPAVKTTSILPIYKNVCSLHNQRKYTSFIKRENEMTKCELKTKYKCLQQQERKTIVKQHQQQHTQWYIYNNTGYHQDQDQDQDLTAFEGRRLIGPLPAHIGSSHKLTPVLKFTWLDRGSNPVPKDSESCALPIEDYTVVTSSQNTDSDFGSL